MKNIITDELIVNYLLSWIDNKISFLNVGETIEKKGVDGFREEHREELIRKLLLIVNKPTLSKKEKHLLVEKLKVAFKKLFNILLEDAIKQVKNKSNENMYFIPNQPNNE